MFFNLKRLKMLKRKIEDIALDIEILRKKIEELKRPQRIAGLKEQLKRPNKKKAIDAAMSDYEDAIAEKELDLQIVKNLLKNI